MAEVFEAELAGELGFSRKVAIKRMLGDAAADPGAAQRFLDEARIASKLHHANIVGVLDVGLLDDLPFQVLELVDGMNAQQLMARAGGHLPLPIALILAGSVAHALDHAHSAHDDAGVPLGIVHRDVKPSNLLVSWGGDVKLSDFGIAVAYDRTALTETGVVAGTAGFIAPEQRVRSEIDGRTDVFALGLTLHALVTGYTPLRELAVEASLLVGETVPIDAALPADIAQLIARAVAPKRTDRLTAAQLADAMGAALASRLTRDARSHLRAFLEPYQPTRPKPGALDQFLGLDVVLADAPDDAPPRYTLLATTAVREPTTPPVPPRRSNRGVIVAVAALGAGGGIAAWQLAGRTSGAAAESAASRSDAAIARAPIDAAIVEDAAIVVEITPDAAVVVPTQHRPRDAGVVAKRVDAAISAGTGWIQVTGEAVVGATVVVDGRAAGSVPYPVEVPTGRHRIELRGRDGAPLPGVHELEVTPAHTEVRPLKQPW
jgi:serine/threonine-protein kinase